MKKRGKAGHEENDEEERIFQTNDESNRSEQQICLLYKYIKSTKIMKANKEEGQKVRRQMQVDGERQK